MNKKEAFFETVKKEFVATLATAAGESVTMRVVSPVFCEGKILMFTFPPSRKYEQLKANPNCALAVGPFFAECSAEFLGATMLPENAALRDTYAAKFPDAFDENVPFGGAAAEFIMLTPKKLTGWGFENDVPTPDGVPTIPFSIELI